MDQKNFVTKTALQSALKQTEQSHWIPIDQKNVTVLLALCLDFRANIRREERGDGSFSDLFSPLELIFSFFNFKKYLRLQDFTKNLILGSAAYI